MKLSRIGWQLTVDNRGQRVKFDQDRSPECTFLASHVVCGSAPATSCYLMGFDERFDKNFDHRKRWIEEKLKQLSANFGIDLLASSCHSNHFHLLLRSRPDVVATWDDKVALRWWQLTETMARVWTGFGKVATRPFEFSMKSRYWLVRPILI